MSTEYLTVLAALLGLLLSVPMTMLVWRLPRLLQREWECERIAALQPEDEEAPPPLAFRLLSPGPHCDACHAPLRAAEIVPLLGYLRQRGACGHCGAPLRRSEPLMELGTALLFAATAWHIAATTLPLGHALPAALLFIWMLLAMSFIDLEHQILPDEMTLGLMVLGLLVNSFDGGLFTSTQSSIIGAAAGYISLWLCFQGFLLLTGKEGLGYGDFKLLAAIGAWLGWQSLTAIVLMAAVGGSVVGITLVLSRRLQRDTPIPFGPYLAAAGWIYLIWGGQISLFTTRLTMP